MTQHHHIMIVQGEHAISSRRDTIIGTVLGSCIAACIYDCETRLGGMNHFMLPDGDYETRHTLKYGLHAMEVLINALLRAGAVRDNLRGKLFGGAQMLAGLPDIGAANASFAREFLMAEKIPCQAMSLGGNRGRKVRFWPATGRVQLQFIAPQEIPLPNIPSPPHPSEIELF